jgi:predicted nuclease of restriction endonuclease-like RecB superfamily
VRFGLADVKKSVVRRQGEAHLAPHLLRPGDLSAALAALIALHEEWVGRERATFPADRPAELLGDYRLARCLVIALSEYYNWSPVAWPGPAEPGEAQALAAHAISSPGQLRLALYDATNTAYGGYLPAAEREAALDAFAASVGLRRATLDALLTLDARDHACLERTAPAPPSPAELALLYNRRAVEALLAHATAVEWILPPSLAAEQHTSLGTLLKRICFLARRMGVYYDVAFAEANPEEQGALQRVAEPPAPYYMAGLGEPPDGASAQPLDAAERALCVTLYGPHEAFGAPTQYGDRLARLCRALLGYQRRPLAECNPSPPRAGVGAARAPRPAAMRGGGLRGEARVHLHGRQFRFALDERLLALLEPLTAAPADDLPASPAIAFDSGLERGLHDAFAALERADAARGWRMEREPEPIVCADTIMIPDFALTRGARRVYLEVAGYWSPSYRERKRRKLAALAGRVALIVAAPEDARPELEQLDGPFPFLWFDGHVSAQALVNLLEARFDDFAARRAAAPSAAVLDEVERRGLLPWRECAVALHAYGRTELGVIASDIAVAAQAAHREPPRLIEGVGLAAPGWLTQVGAAIAAWVAASGAEGLALRELAARLGDLAPGAAVWEDGLTAAEALAQATGHSVARASLFEPRVLAAGADTRATPIAEAPPAPDSQPRRAPRRKLHGRTSAADTAAASQAQPLPWNSTAE